MFRTPHPDRVLESVRLGGRTLREWHTWLNTDQGGDTWQGHTQVVGSRYGRTVAECSYWALAATVVTRAERGRRVDVTRCLVDALAQAVADDDRLERLVRHGVDDLPHLLVEWTVWNLPGKRNAPSGETAATLAAVSSRAG